MVTDDGGCGSSSGASSSGGASGCRGNDSVYLAFNLYELCFPLFVIHLHSLLQHNTHLIIYLYIAMCIDRV